MSRRKEREWEDVLSRNVFGGGEVYYTDWKAVAREFGLEPSDFLQPGAWRHEGEPDLDVEALKEAARELLYNRDDKWPPFVMLTLKCQRCERRLDTLRVRAQGWRAGADGGYMLDEPKLISEASAKIVGEAWAHPERTGPLEYQCGCGRGGIQFSRRRIGEILGKLMPTQPDWRSSNGEEYIAHPTTRYASIHG